MGFVDKLNSCCRSMTVRIILTVLLLVAIVLGAVWFFVIAEDETHDLSFAPKFENQTLIQVKGNDNESVRAIVRKIDELLKPYNSSSANDYKGCNFNNPPPTGKTCDVDISTFYPCTKVNSYGYNRAAPCVFLKLSKQNDWVPQFLNDQKLPEDLPEVIASTVKNLVSKNKNNSKLVWVSCEGRSAADKVNIGPIQYLPRGFYGFYFPCTSEIECTKPLVAVHFQRPATNTVIGVTCRIWAENAQDKIDFELLIE